MCFNRQKQEHMHMKTMQVQCCYQYITTKLIAMDNEKLIDELNDIIVRNYDASKGFQNAADNVKSSSLKTIFTDASTQRSTFAGELQQEVRTLGGEPKNESSALGAAHRTWMDVKSALSTNEDEAILDACVTGEKAAVKEYDKLLKKPDVPDVIRQRVEAQRNVVQRTLDEVRELEHISD